MTDEMIKCITSTETGYVDDIISDLKKRKFITYTISSQMASKTRNLKRKAVTQDGYESSDESVMDGISEEEIEKENEEWKRYIFSNVNYNEDDVRMKTKLI